MNESHSEFQLDVRIIAEPAQAATNAPASGDCTDTCATLPNCFVESPS
ncbi:hypothetical protein ABZ635_01115 [Nocardiopsis sp. NPDC007018]